MEKIVNVKGRQIKVVPPEIARDNITLSDADMDNRARCAVRSALAKAKVCNKPIAKYDTEAQEAYIEYPDGTRKYIE